MKHITRDALGFCCNLNVFVLVSLLSSFVDWLVLVTFFLLVKLGCVVEHEGT